MVPSEPLTQLAEKSLLAAGLLDPSAAYARVLGLLRGIFLVLKFHGAKTAVMVSLATQLATYLGSCDEAKFLKRTKVVLATPMARYLRNAVPVIDEPFVPTGAWRRWSKSRLVAFTKKNTHLWFSFLQCKRSCLPLSDEYVLDVAYDDHRDAMKCPDPLALGVSEAEDVERTALIDRALLAIKPVLEIIGKSLSRTTYEGLLDLDHHASQSASLEQTRSAGGQAGQFNFELAMGVNQRPPVAKMFDEHETMVRMTAVRGPVSVVEQARDKRGRALGVDFKTSRFNTVEVEKADVERREMFVERLRRWIDCAPMPENLTAKIQGIVEPLKVRVISKGSSAPYYLAKGLQKALHDSMRHLPCFRLIGRPFSPTDLFDLERLDGELGITEQETFFWFSGDYKASTDNSSARLGMAIFDSLLAYLPASVPERYKQWMRLVLAPHICVYPKQSYLDPVLQTNGQLMGSPLSFPILCLMNLAIFAMATGASRHELIHKVLINGDDILYRATRAEFHRHNELGSRCGLSPSIGKVYLSPEYANINSICCHTGPPIRIERVRSQPPRMSRAAEPTHKYVIRDVRQIDFLNTGLFFGQQKVMARVGGDVDANEVRANPTTAVINTLLQGALRGTAHELLKMYLSKHRHDINKETKGKNLFIHQTLGGMGVVPPCGFEPSYTWQQLAVATTIWMKSINSISSVRPYPNVRLVPSSAPRVQPWHVIHSDDTDLEEDDRITNPVRKRLAVFVHGRRPLPPVLLISGIVLTANLRLNASPGSLV